MRCFPIGRLIPTSCYGTGMADSGLERTKEGLFIYITAEPTYSRNPTDSQATSAVVSLKIGKATFGTPAREDSIDFENFPSLRFPQNRAYPAIILVLWSQAR